MLLDLYWILLVSIGLLLDSYWNLLVSIRFDWISVGFDRVSIGLLLDSHWDLFDYNGFYWISIGFYWISILFCWILLDYIGFLLDCCWIPIGIYRILLDPIATVCALPSPARVRVEAHFSGPVPRA